MIQRASSILAVFCLLCSSHAFSIAPPVHSLSRAPMPLSVPMPMQVSIPMQVSGPSSSSSRSSFSTALPALAIEAAQEGSWKAYLDDEKTGLIFYYNHQTGESKWEPPSPSFPAVQLNSFLKDRTTDVREAYLNTVKKDQMAPFKNIGNFFGGSSAGVSASASASSAETSSGASMAKTHVNVMETKSETFSKPFGIPSPSKTRSLKKKVEATSSKSKTAKGKVETSQLQAPFQAKLGGNIENLLSGLGNNNPLSSATKEIESVKPNGEASASKTSPKTAKVETSQGSFPGKLGGDIENFLSGLTNSLTSATQDKDIEQPVKQPNGGGGGPPEPEREDKFTFAQKIESTKAGIAGLVTGASVLLPFTAVSTLVSDSSNKGAQFGLDTAIGGVESALFAIVYRYCVRDGEESNAQLGNGVAGAFAITRALSSVSGDLDQLDMGVLSQFAFSGVESLAMFYAVKAALDIIVEKGFIKRMD